MEMQWILQVLAVQVMVVLHQSASAPVQASAPGCTGAQRPVQNCSSIATDHTTLAWRLFRSSVALSNFSLPVGVRHENRQTSWSRHSSVQDGVDSAYNIPDYTACPRTGKAWPTQTQISKDSNSLCQWTYECDFNAGRVPAFLHQAKCSKQLRQFQVDGQDYRYQCKPIPTSIKVLMLSGCSAASDIEEWKLEDYVISTGCVPIQV